MIKWKSFTLKRGRIVIRISRLLWYHGLTDEVLASLHPGIEAPGRVIVREVPGEKLRSDGSRVGDGLVLAEIFFLATK